MCTTVVSSNSAGDSTQKLKFILYEGETVTVVYSDFHQPQSPDLALSVRPHRVGWTQVWFPKHCAV
jgi:hypothetical protein